MRINLLSRTRWAVLGICLLFCLPHQPSRAENARLLWQTNISQAWKSAKQLRRPLVLLLTSEQCYHCKRLANITLEDEHVQSELRDHFVAAAVQAQRYPDLVRHLQVRMYPTTVIISPAGKVIESIEGYSKPSEYQRRLQQARTRPENGAPPRLGMRDE